MHSLRNYIAQVSPEGGHLIQQFIFPGATLGIALALHVGHKVPQALYFAVPVRVLRRSRRLDAEGFPRTEATHGAVPSSTRKLDPSRCPLTRQTCPPYSMRD